MLFRSKMAQEAGMREGWDGWTTGDDPNCMYPECVYTENLERFFHMAQAAEREKVAEEIFDMCKEGWWDSEGMRHHWNKRGQA